MSRIIEFRMKLTPRQRILLHNRLSVKADEAYDDIETHGDAAVDLQDVWMVFDQFPACTWELPVSWRRAAARAFDDLVGDLDEGVLPRPRSLAEQLALVLSLAAARGAMIDHDYGPDVDELPAHPDDTNWEAVYDELLDDRDIEAFYSPDPADVAAWVAIAPPTTWFNPLPGTSPRNPARGYRR